MRAPVPPAPMTAHHDCPYARILRCASHLSAQHAAPAGPSLIKLLRVGLYWNAHGPGSVFGALSCSLEPPCSPSNGLPRTTRRLAGSTLVTSTTRRLVMGGPLHTHHCCPCASVPPRVTARERIADPLATPGSCIGPARSHRPADPRTARPGSRRR